MITQLNRFNLKEKLYQKSVINKISDLKKGKIGYPLVIDFDPTTACNLACKHCISSRMLNKKEFSKEQLLKLANEFIEIGVKAIILTGGGEPLMNKNISDFILALKRGNIKVGLVTNGILISQHVDSLQYIDWIRVSVDAATDDTFYKLKLRHAFDTIINGMKILNIKKKGAVGYSFLIVNNDEVSNVHEIYNAAVIAKEIGCDYFELKNKFDESHRNIMLPSEKMNEIIEQLNKIKELEDDKFKIYTNYNVKNIILENGNLDQKCNQCYVSNLRTVITSSGAYLCSYHRGNESKKYGDVINNSFSEIWMSDNRKSLYSNTNPTCDCSFHCARNASNYEIFNIMTEENQNNKKVVNDYDLFV